MAELVGWAVLFLAAWFVLGLPVGLLIGRRLRNRQPPPDV